MPPPRLRPIARAALERIKCGILPKFDHNQEFMRHIAKARYGTKEPLLSTVPLAKIIQIICFLQMKEWKAIQEYPDLLENVMEYPAELGNWMPFWRNVQALNPAWGRIVLLEVTYGLWQGNVNELFKGVHCLSQGVLPTDGKSLSDPDQAAATTPTATGTLPAAASPPAAAISPTAGSSWLSSILQPTEINLAATPSSITFKKAADVPEAALENKAKLLQYIKAAFWTEPGRIANIESRVKELDPEYISDLYRSISENSGLDICMVKKVVDRAWSSLGNTDGYQLERELGLPYTGCLALHMDMTGDYTLAIKVPRVDGLMLAIEYLLPTRASRIDLLL